jgi:hypothetical protein
VRVHGGNTASDTIPTKGTLAADTRYYPYGTVMNIPGAALEDRK